MEPLRLVPSRRFENHDFRRRSSLADSSVRAGLLAKLATRRLLRDPNGTTRADIGARTRFLQRAEARDSPREKWRVAQQVVRAWAPQRWSLC